MIIILVITKEMMIIVVILEKDDRIQECHDRLSYSARFIHSFFRACITVIDFLTILKLGFLFYYILGCTKKRHSFPCIWSSQSYTHHRLWSSVIHVQEGLNMLLI